jgi:hypothetical protein
MAWRVFAIRMGIALLFGALIGAERQWRQRMAEQGGRESRSAILRTWSRCSHFFGRFNAEQCECADQLSAR